MIYTNIFIMKRGDVILYKGKRGKIVDIIGNRCKIIVFDSINKSGREVETWVSISDVKLDKKYYRELKLKKFLKSTF